MIRRLPRAVAAALLGTLTGVLWISLFYLSRPALHVDFGSELPRTITGIHPSERDVNGRTFAWTGEDAAIRLPGLDRRVEWTLRLHARRPPTANTTRPILTISVDGVVVHHQAVEEHFGDIHVTVPARPERPRGVLITLRSSESFVPGGGDARRLGVMLDAIELTPTGLALPPVALLFDAAMSGALLGAALALTGVTAGTAIGGVTVLMAGQGAVLTAGFAPYTTASDLAPALALWIGIAVVVATALVEWRRQVPLRNTARFALAFSAAAAFLKLLLLAHPNAPLGDAVFHAHRFRDVVGGSFYFTSIAPGNYSFPYAPGLYVLALPFASFVRPELGDVALLRAIVIGVDAVAGALLYYAVTRHHPHRLAGAWATAAYQLIPLSFGVIATGNLTNAFAQSISVCALVTMVVSRMGHGHWRGVLLLFLLLTLAFVSHTSAFAILTLAALTIAHAWFWHSRRELRTAAVILAAVTLVSVGVAVAIYYAHFMDTYRTEFARLSGETATAAPDAGGRGIGERAYGVPRYLYLYFGIPVLALAAGGLWSWVRQGLRDRLTLATSGWLLACAAFLVLGVVTPVDMRYYLAAIPAMAVTAAAGASYWWKSGANARIVTVILLGWMMWNGIATWWGTLVK